MIKIAEEKEQIVETPVIAGGDVGLLPLVQVDERIINRFNGRQIGVRFSTLISPK